MVQDRGFDSQIALLAKGLCPLEPQKTFVFSKDLLDLDRLFRRGLMIFMRHKKSTPARVLFLESLVQQTTT